MFCANANAARSWWHIVKSRCKEAPLNFSIRTCCNDSFQGTPRSNGVAMHIIAPITMQRTRRLLRDHVIGAGIVPDSLAHCIYSCPVLNLANKNQSTSKQIFYSDRHYD
jgi:hypothetical protein